VVLPGYAERSVGPTARGPAGPLGQDGPVSDVDRLRDRLARARLYLCTDSREDRGDLGDFLDAVCSGGVDVVQLRDKRLEAREELAALAVMRAVCARHDVLMAVNDRADIAFAANADVLHLGQDDLPVAVAREVVGSDMLIGRSTHDAVESDSAAGEVGVDYYAVGPCWPTPTKPGRPAPGLELVRHVASMKSAVPRARPWFAIGGIDLFRLDEALDSGARRVVVVRALTEAPTLESAHNVAREFASRLAARELASPEADS